MDQGERQRLARVAETCVAEHLRRSGYEIVARNLRLGPLELDLVARHRDLIVVVEVRTRGARSWTTAHGSVLARKRERLRRAARRLWRVRYAHDPSVQRLRFDVAAVMFTPAGPVVDYCPAAFT